jgi:hypothetical protein
MKTKSRTDANGQQATEATPEALEASLRRLEENRCLKCSEEFQALLKKHRCSIHVRQTNLDGQLGKIEFIFVAERSEER